VEVKKERKKIQIHDTNLINTENGDGSVGGQAQRLLLRRKQIQHTRGGHVLDTEILLRQRKTAQEGEGEWGYKIQKRDSFKLHAKKKSTR
jgi:hypothetical protein